MPPLESPVPARSSVGEVQIRPLRTHEDYRACVALQRLIWGDDFAEEVPPTILKVCQRIGGVAAGAFGRDDALLGFVFGLTGVENGRIVHWSDMLAVHPRARNLGLGKRLKGYQHDVLAAQGVEVMYWSYDPLVARNAHLNLTRLGARVVEYVPDMYGPSVSRLHRGLGTDRFVVAWRVSVDGDGDGDGGREGEAAPGRDGKGVAKRLADGDGADGHGVEGGDPIVNPAGEVPRKLPAGDRLRVLLPADIEVVQARSLEEAAGWRQSTRAAFLAAFAQGYEVTGFRRGAGSAPAHYLLERRRDKGAEGADGAD